MLTCTRTLAFLHMSRPTSWIFPDEEGQERVARKVETSIMANAIQQARAGNFFLHQKTEGGCTSVVVVKSFSVSSSFELFSRFLFAFSRFVLCRQPSIFQYNGTAQGKILSTRHRWQ